MAHSDFIDTTGSYYNTTFEGVINQEWENGTWQTPTPIITFRQIRAHFYTGVLRCEPITYDPVTRITYCPYPESQRQQIQHHIRQRLIFSNAVPEIATARLGTKPPAFIFLCYNQSCRN